MREVSSQLLERRPTLIGSFARSPFLLAVCLVILTCTAVSAGEPVQVYILAGQSNMEGKAKVSLLEYQATEAPTREMYAHLRTPKGGWVARDDVWIKFLDRQGPLTVGFGSPGRIGPELEFGHVMGDHCTAPVLLIKTAWGGKSLFRDFRPPSSGLPEPGVLNAMLDAARKGNPDATLDTVKGGFGACYRRMLDEVRSTLDDLSAVVPGYQGEGYELSGFVWFQGWNDMIHPEYTAEYADNLAYLVRDVRRDLGAPGLPFVVGQFGVGGVGREIGPKPQALKDAQAEASALEAFRGNVALVRTDQYWDEDAQAVFDRGWREHPEAWDKVGSDYPYHYLGSAKTMLWMGRGFAEAMLGLRGER